MPYKVGQDIGGFGRLMEAERWISGQERLDAQEARNARLSDLQMQTAQANLAEVKRGREFKMGMAQATSQVQGVVEKFHARMDYLDQIEATHPDLAEAERMATFERADKMTDDLYDRDPKSATYLEDQLLGEYHRRRGQESFKISDTPEDNVQKITMPDGSVSYQRRVWDETSKKYNWVEDAPAGAAGMVRKGPEAKPTDQDDYVDALRQAAEDEGKTFTARDEAKARISFKRASPEERAAVTTAVEESKRKAKLMGQMPKARASLRAFDRKTDLTVTTIEEALALADATTTGMAAKATKNIPGTDAFTLREKLKTIQANIAFGYLQEMRNNSPTGGAVGQLSERELELMGVTKASLNQDLDDDALRANLERIKQELTDMLGDAKVAYEMDFGAQFEGQPGEIEFLGWE
jgi:hypothetical protein